MSTKKFEKLIDLIINEDQEAARALFHDIVVEKSRTIYESLIEDETSSLDDEISSEETGSMDDGEYTDDEEMSGDYDVDGEEGEFEIDDEEEFGDMDDMGEEPAELEDRLVDVEDKLDQLMAEFEAQMGSDDEEEGMDDIGGSAMGQPGSNLGLNNFSAGKDNRKAWDVPDLKEYHGKDVTVTEALTDRAIAEMRKAHSAGVPFFLNFAHFGVHTPIEPAKNFSADYASLPLSRTEKDYATMVADVDASVGRVMAELDKMGVADNTIIVFLSDNGGFAQRDGGFKPKNLPLRSGKGSAYEGGLRVPCVVRWPGITQPGSRIDAPIRMEDLLPTLAKAAGVKAPTGIDGGDISAVLAGGKRVTPDFIWYYPHVWGATGPGIEPFAAIREGDLKAILFLYDERVELYDITKDPSESKDLAKEHPQEAIRLKLKLITALKTGGRDLPTR
jgi:hypothetical protein